LCQRVNGPAPENKEIIMLQEFSADYIRQFTQNGISTTVSACLNWLRERYMKNMRDNDLDECLKEILETDRDGNLTAVPQRNGLIQEVRGLLTYGETRDGKTALLARNLIRQPSIGLSYGTGPGRALYIKTPPDASLKGVAMHIIKKTG
jgi:hypothetical protein